MDVSPKHMGVTKCFSINFWSGKGKKWSVKICIALYLSRSYSRCVAGGCYGESIALEEMYSVNMQLSSCKFLGNFWKEPKVSIFYTVIVL